MRRHEGKPGPAPLIEYRNLNVVRDGRHLLSNINLKIAQGEHVAILGPNGAGKSSLIKTITREYYPSAGDGQAVVRILGEEFWDVFELRNHLGIVYGELIRSGLREISCFDFVLSGFFSSLGLWPGQNVTRSMKRKAEQALASLEILSLAGQDLNTLSSGESRKAMIARCLVHDPPTVLLDEPTASLDLKATYELRATLRKLVHQGKSLIMITQNLSDIIPEIERVILLKNGRIMADGPKEKCLTSGRLSRLFGIDLDLLRKDGYYYCF
jgi:iron complex transport system ATP-binding protein